MAGSSLAPSSLCVHLVDASYSPISAVICSFKQVRSFGSSAGFMSGKLQVVDVFVVDFDEEASAAFGDQFVDQTTFVNDAVITIRSLYDEEFCE